MDKLYWLSGQREGNFIVVTPNGMNDCNEVRPLPPRQLRPLTCNSCTTSACYQINCQQQGLSTVGWNTFGTGVDADGPLGPTCNTDRVKYGSYPCYSSCRQASPRESRWRAAGELVEY